MTSSRRKQEIPPEPFLRQILFCLHALWPEDAVLSASCFRRGAMCYYIMFIRSCRRNSVMAIRYMSIFSWGCKLRSKVNNLFIFSCSPRFSGRYSAMASKSVRSSCKRWIVLPGFVSNQILCSLHSLFPDCIPSHLHARFFCRRFFSEVNAVILLITLYTYSQLHSSRLRIADTIHTRRRKTGEGAPC